MQFYSVVNVNGLHIYMPGNLVDLEAYMKSVPFFTTERPALLPRKKKLTPEQQDTYRSSRSETEAKNNEVARELMQHAERFFGKDARRGERSGWTGRVPLYVPVAELEAWIDDVCIAAPEKRAFLNINVSELMEAICEKTKEMIRGDIEILDKKRKVLEAELEDTRPMVQVKRVRREVVV